MANWVARGVPAALLILAVAGCSPLPDEPQLCKRRNTTDAMTAPPGVARRHPRAAPGDRRESREPLMRMEQRAVWHYADGDLIPAVATEHVDLLGDTPVGEIALRDAATGAELVRHSLIYELRDPEHLVYAHDDGRPLNTPLGDAFLPGFAEPGHVVTYHVTVPEPTASCAASRTARRGRRRRRR
jgi:hypothetical protein